MLKWLQGADVITLLILKIITITTVFHEQQLTLAQLSSLSRPQDYGPPSGGGIGGNGNAGGNGSGGGDSGEILAPKSFPLSGQEPTCEELRAMWRFSKRQSRAAEMTNEIPTYRDPFVYNVWEPYYATTRSIGGMRLMPRYRDSNRPVYGRIIHREPIMRLAERTRSFEGMSRLYNPESVKGGSAVEPRRRVQFRFSGGMGSNGMGGASSSGGNSGNSVVGGGSATANSLTPHYGSFQKLKELIWTERARELAQQRKAEEMAARAAVLKEIANGFSIDDRKPASPNTSPMFDENRAPDSSSSDQERPFNTIVALPNSGSRSSSSMFSSNPSSQLNRSGGLLLPVQLPGALSIGGGGQQGAKSFLARPSHFRERNRVLFRQSGTPVDYYQREHRSQSINDQLEQLAQLQQYYQQQPDDSDKFYDYQNLFY